MIRDLLIGLGMVAVVEGLLLATAPSRLMDVLELLVRLSEEQKRTIGLTAVAAGVAIVWIAR
jgi:uncharacterized protein